MKTFTKDSLIVASRQELIDIICEQAAHIDQLANSLTELTMKYEWMQRQVYGTKSERFIADADIQTALDLGVVSKQDLDKREESQPITDTRKKASPDTPVQGHGRGSMPTHLPIKKNIIEPEGDTTGMEKIGEEVTWYYEMDKPSQLHIVMLVRPKYALPQKNGVVIGSLPPLPVEKGNAGPGFIAHITEEKYIYHMPLDRQRKKFQLNYGAVFSESWLSDTIGKAVFWFDAVLAEYKKKVLTSSYLQADETPIMVLTRDKKGKTHRGYLWVYHDPIRRLVLFDYRESRSHKGPSDFLKDFRGTLQVDGYEGYADIISRNGLVHAGCMDHVRRRFETAKGYDAARAVYALDTMRRWYAVEREAREKALSFDERLALRKETVAAEMTAFKIWMQNQMREVLPKSPIGVALSYALNQWGYFDPYLSDGRIELSNILIENAIRPVAVGRKNFLFAGSHAAARWPAVIYSLAAIAQYHGVTPFDYFKELLTELPGAHAQDIGKYLLPEWKPRSTIIESK
jgi:transposase